MGLKTFMRKILRIETSSLKMSCYLKIMSSKYVTSAAAKSLILMAKTLLTLSLAIIGHQNLSFASRSTRQL